ncbi:MAG: HAMP domain-containing histidine kinase [Myxococcales bacterium]|nr:HAMP domain-containing histidine kinase [Myxococcales bacterium]
MYDEAKQQTAALTAQMAAVAVADDERAWVADIDRATRELDQTFRERVVPAVLAGDAASAQREHQRVLTAMGRAQARTDRLARRFSESVTALEALVAQTERRALWWGVGFLLIAPALAVAAGILIGRSVARPIARLRTGAARIAGGDLDTRIAVDTADEFGALAQQFNAMATALKLHQHERVQSERLAGIGRLAAGVAHEINNPLGVILGYAKLLGKQAEGGLADDLRVIEAETLRCKEIVDGLLDLARPIRLAAEPVDLRELTDDVVARLAVAEAAAPVQVEGQAVVPGDGPRLRQVIFNLIKNAIEAAGPTGRVDVRLTETAAEVVVAVHDTGAGFDAAAREHLFEPFFTTKPRGTGLGLAVSQAIARGHGGELELAPAAAGTRVALRLPRAREAA